MQCKVVISKDLTFAGLTERVLASPKEFALSPTCFATATSAELKDLGAESGDASLPRCPVVS